jgi:hypothetical protein
MYLYSKTLIWLTQVEHHDHHVSNQNETIIFYNFLYMYMFLIAFRLCQKNRWSW